MSAVMTDASHTITYLQEGVSALMAEVIEDAGWQFLMNPASPADGVRAVLRELYCEVAAYQPDMIEATITSIGQFPHTLSAKKVRLMLVHAAEEWDHAEMAVRDYVGLGHDAAHARTFRSPTAFATAACWRLFAHKRMPFAYLGATYLLEGLTPLISSAVTPALEQKGVEPRALEFLQFHATEDLRHTAVVEELIRTVLLQYPDKAADIEFGFDAFRHVFPLPGWRAAFRRARVVVS